MIDVHAVLRENAELRAMIAASQATNAALIAEISKLNDRVAELLVVARRNQRKPAKERPPAPPPVVEAEAKRAFEDRPKPPELPKKEKPPKEPKKPTGRAPVPESLEAELHELRPDRCGSCGGTALDAMETLDEVKLHVVKEHQRRRVVKRTTCRCRTCGERTTPLSLPAPYARSKVTSDWLAWLVHSKFVLLTPLDRIRRDLAERGIRIAMGTLVLLIERAADLLAPIDGLHWRSLLAGSWMATDSTGLKVLIPGLSAAHNGYLELYRNREAAVFQYSAAKDGEGVVEKLKPFRGTLTADAEHRYNAVYDGGRVIEAGCNAHGRRKFRDAEATQPSLAAEGGAFVAAMYEAEERASKLGLEGEALVEHRRRFIRPITDDFDRWLRAVAPTLLPSEPLSEAVRYYLNHWNALLRFIDDPDVPIDNSPTEREFQNVAKLRLNMLFAGSTEGAHRACVLLGIVASCRAIGVPVLAYLSWAFDRLGTHRAVFGLDLPEMTPAAFKATLE